MSQDWRSEAKGLTVLDAARRLGLAVSKDRFGPCPACKAARYKDERRPPLHGLRAGKGWICNACNTTGDVLDLVAWALLGCRGKDAGARFSEVRAWFEGGSTGQPTPASSPEPAPEELRRIPETELRTVLRASAPAQTSPDPAARAWLDRRSLNDGPVPAFLLPGSSWSGWRGMDWWPAPWADRWPLAVPAYTGTGRLAGLHGRAIHPDQERQQKTTWARGVSAKGLIFADPWRALPVLRGHWSGVRTLVFVEGLTDFLSAALDAQGSPGDGIAVLGVESGSASAVALLRGLPDHVGLYVGTHDDPAGDRYAEAIIAQLALAHRRADVRRLPLWLLREAA